MIIAYAQSLELAGIGANFRVNQKFVQEIVLLAEMCDILGGVVWCIVARNTTSVASRAIHKSFLSLTQELRKKHGIK
jgi:hypothetical protein